MAIMVAADVEIDMAGVERRSLHEGMMEELERIMSLLRMATETRGIKKQQRWPIGHLFN